MRQYQIRHEPLYEFECLLIIQAIVNKKSIIDELDVIERKRGTSVRKDLEPLFEKALAMENYLKKHLQFNFAGYESEGEEHADFLFKLGERLEMAPAYVFFCYEQLKKYLKITNKRVAVIAYALEDKFDVEEWETHLDSLESDQLLFECLDDNLNSSVEKFDLMKLYYKFDVYHDYLSKLLDQAISLYQEKLSDFSSLVHDYMDEINQELTEKGATFLKEELNLTLSPDVIYTVCPSIYRLNSLQLNGVTKWDLHLIFGLSFFEVARYLEPQRAVTNENIQEFLKCVADQTKLSILQLTLKEPMYGAQLAENLNLTTATISHHMTALIKLKLINIEKKGNKVFFHVNSQRLNDVLDGFQKLFVTPEAEVGGHDDNR